MPRDQALAILEREARAGTLLNPASAHYYDTWEKERLAQLTPEKRNQAYNQKREDWSKVYPEFNSLLDIVERIRKDNNLAGYPNSFAPISILNAACRTYKKCIPFREKLTKEIYDHLIYRPGSKNIAVLCVSPDIAKSFLDEFRHWFHANNNLWKSVAALANEIDPESKILGWPYYIRSSSALSKKLCDAEILLRQSLESIESAWSLISKHESIIDAARISSFGELSIFEWEEKMRKIADDVAIGDEVFEMEGINIRALYSMPRDTAFTFLDRASKEGLLHQSPLSVIYDGWEEARVKSLPTEQQKSEYLLRKEQWCKDHPDFKRICEAVELFAIDGELAEFARGFPPWLIFEAAITLYKKCISFRTRFTKQIEKHLRMQPDAPAIHHHQIKPCISLAVVDSFLHDFREWICTSHCLWNPLYYMRQDVIHNSGYDRLGWRYYISNPGALRRKADQTDELVAKIRKSISSAWDLLSKHDEIINNEYAERSTEMSIFERENEIRMIADERVASDEEYCYVYTLECSLCVFYVGIAGDPKQRFEQHIRGAFGEESHLFKSKFIQKYRSEIRQKIIFEGTRRECKLFEIEYISLNKPLGNMTDGGE